MKNKRLVFLICFVLAIFVTSFTLTWAREVGSISLTPDLPFGSGFTYQGYLTDGGSPANGVYDFEFTLYDAETNGLSLGTDYKDDVSVDEGLFTVQIDFGSDVFDGNTRWLAIGVRPGNETGDYTALDDRQPITPSPYALYAVDADTVDGMHASELGTHYQNVVVVAKSGGDYTSVQGAINSITSAAADNPYLVWVAPGVYSETVTMKPFVHLQGAGQEATVITSSASSEIWPPDQVTLALASDTSLRDLTVVNSGTGYDNLALLATGGVTRTLVANVTAQALGGGEYYYAILLNGSDTGVTLQEVTALGENGSEENYGLYSNSSAATTLHSGSFTGRGGTYAYGVFNGSGSTLEAESIRALGEGASTNNYGLRNNSGSEATLRGGSFTARGGADARGIYNIGTITTLEAESVTALGENGTSNYGLYNSARATLRGGSFTGRGGIYVYGIYNAGSNKRLEAESVTALGENGSTENYGLNNQAGATVTLNGGSFTGRGGANTIGIWNYGSDTTLDAKSVNVLAENGSNSNYGLANVDAADATANSSKFTGSSNGVIVTSSTVHLGVCQLDGGITSTSGTLACFQVYDENYVSIICP